MHRVWVGTRLYHSLQSSRPIVAGVLEAAKASDRLGKDEKTWPPTLLAPETSFRAAGLNDIWT